MSDDGRPYPRCMTCRTLAAATLAVLLAGCSGSAGSPGPSTPSAPAADDAGPTRAAEAAAWPRVTPRRAGFDPGRLREAAQDAKRARSSCYVVVRDGRLVVEDYWRGGWAETPKPAFSVTKLTAIRPV